LRDFCSRPLPEFRAVDADAGFIYGELIGVGLGKRGAITCIEGNVARSVISRYRGEHSRANQLCVGVHVPCETLVLDLLVQDGTYDLNTMKPKIAAYGEQMGGPPYPARSQTCEPLPVRESVEYLGRGTSVMHVADVPRYAEMAQYVFDRLKWRSEQFHVFRCRMQYPIMPTTVVMRFDLPDAPST
jgi:hypothetical protein